LALRTPVMGGNYPGAPVRGYDALHSTVALDLR